MIKIRSSEQWAAVELNLYLCILAAVIKGLEVFFMISFVYITKQAIKKDQKYIPSRTFKFIKCIIVISNIMLEFIVMGLFGYLMYHLDFETSIVFAITFYSISMTQLAAYSELKKADQI